jgi:hypothetical protein
MRPRSLVSATRAPYLGPDSSAGDVFGVLGEVGHDIDGHRSVPVDAAAASIKVSPLWLDVAAGNYPVVDALRVSGKHGHDRFPEDARGAERRKIGPAQHFTAPADLTLVAPCGRLHPGGLWVD